MTTKVRLIELVNLVPKGKAVSYGQLARILGISAQMVGWLLSGMPRSTWGELPWWRVVAKDGTVSSLKLGQKGIEQLDLLSQEGFNVKDEQVDMIKHCYDIEVLVTTKKDLLNSQNKTEES